MIVYCFDPSHMRHAEPGHPERPERLDAAMVLLEEDGMLARLRQVPTPAVTREALERVHDPSYLDLVETVALFGDVRLDDDTYCTPESIGVAERATGGLLSVTDAVLTGAASSGFALVRPPGHHARPFRAMGFCLYSNVAVAVRHAQAVHGLERVMVVDMDVHHGNGTQEAFYDDPSVLFVSSQQYPLWPGTGALEETGAGAGEGTTVNIPLPTGTDDALDVLYRRILPPLAARFRPQAVFLSAGYDAHRLDPLAGLGLSIAGLADLVRVVAEVADQHAGGRLIASLEGGYHAEALAHGVLSTLRVMEDGLAEASDPFGPEAVIGPDLGPLAEALAALHRL
ncbi:MAG TPA: histone deacetylase [Rhodothermales bacterium]|nr:histone deacetylase [Rhodothermales bacterium]